MSDRADLVIRDVRVFDPGRGIDAPRRNVAVEGERIASLDAQTVRGEIEIEGGGRLLCPGLIDLRAHLGEPGRTKRETIATGTKAAAVGGFTSVVMMPTTEPTVDRVEVAELILGRARAAGPTRVLPAAALSVGRAGERMSELGRLKDAGCVLATDGDRSIVDSQLLRYAMEASVVLHLPVMTHADDASLSLGGVLHEGVVSTRLGLMGRPGAAESVGVARDIAVAALTGARLHIAHISTAESVDLVRQAKRRGVRLTADANPLNLILTDESVLGYNTQAKVFPPLRPQSDVDAVVTGLADGTLDAVASDHLPVTSLEKNVEFEHAAPGAIGLETALAVVLTLGARGRLTVQRAIAAMTRAPAGVLGRRDLGRLSEGGPADLVLIDDKAEWTFTPKDIGSRSVNSPLLGYSFVGRTMLTVARGQITHRNEALY